ncbi:MAG: DUF3298 and DUF4163 domain-containing protein [Intestinibacter sp.]|uniref:DUF3298 and DUF4163 domain-containing protein n=1 Tax=Intestinibacter sp. TaxID=1965304 RepID=UPI003F17E9F0
MKKLTAIIILITGILTISVLNFAQVREVFELNIKDVSVDTKVINKDNKFIKANLKIPVLIIANKEMQGAINKKIESDIIGFYNNAFKEAQSYFNDFPNQENQFAISSDFEVKKNTDKVFSILIKYYRYSGGAHGNYEYVPYNIDLTSGRVFILNDVFKENLKYQEVINQEIRRQIRELNIKNNLPEESTQLYSFNGIKEGQKFYLTDDKIIVFFDLYDIAPYVAGIPEFEIGRDIVENIMNPKYIDIIFSTPITNKLS